MVITAFFGIQLQSLEFDFEFEKFFPKNHPDSKLYAKHVEQFGYDNDFVQIILQNEGSVFDTSFLRKAIAFEAAIQRIEDVKRVFSPLTLKHAVRSPTGIVIFPLLHANDPTKLKADSSRVMGNEFYKATFSLTDNAISIYLNHDHFDDPIRSEALMSSIEEAAAKNQLNQVRLVGKVSASTAFIRYMQNDFGKFLIGSFVLSFGLLLLIFKDLKSGLLPFLISLLSNIWLFGLMASFGVKINLLTTLIPPILFFVSMSDSIHLMNALKKVEAVDRKQRIIQAIRIVWTPTLLTSVTTAIGFISLIWISTELVQVLGLFTSIGVLFAFILTFTLGIIYTSFTDFQAKKKIIGLPDSLPNRLASGKLFILAASIILVGASIPGILRLEINSYLLDDLPNDSIIRQDFEYADQHMKGSKPFEVRVEVNDPSYTVWDQSVMEEIFKIEAYLMHEYPVAKVQSPATIIKYLNMVNNGGLNEHYRKPDSEKDYKRALQLKNKIDPKRMDKLVTENGKVARLIGFIPEFGSQKTGRRNEELLHYLDSNVDKSRITYNLTGTTYLIDKSHELLSRHLIQGLITAVLLISIVLGVYFRSWKLVLISLIPNLIPLLLVAGLIGWLGISLKMTISVIFAVVFGIAVDDTIHMMSYYLNAKEHGDLERIKSTFKHAGSAMLITSLIMCAGFILFLFSSFGATYYLGLFITLSLFIALITDLTILPLLLLLFSKDAKKRRSLTKH